MVRRVDTVVSVLSCQGYGDRRARCRQTWFGELASQPGICAFFVVGIPGVSEPIFIDDLLLVDAPDDYGGLTRKTEAAARWVVKNTEFRRLWKADDDTYIDVHRWGNLLAVGEDYVGHKCLSRNEHYATGGSGYLLSRKAVEIIAQGLGADSSAEDWQVAEALRNKGISLRHDSRLGMAAHDSGFISCHPIRDDTMYSIHQSVVQGRRRQESFEILDAHVSWGVLGLNGYLGYDGTGRGDFRVQISGIELSSLEWHFVSAHAPSRLTIQVREALACLGFLNKTASDLPANPTIFRIDGNDLSTITGPQHRTAVITLERGLHVLEVTCDNIRERHSVWAIARSAASSNQLQQ